MVSEPPPDPSETRARRVDELVVELLDLSDDDRQRRLTELEGDDALLRGEIERLLAVDSGWVDELDVPAFEHIERWRDEDRLGEEVGAYRLEAHLGRGGTSTVFLGRRTRGLGPRQVAVKILAAAALDDVARRRFTREAEILSRLDHPNIATIFGGGITRDGSPYLLIEYIEGVPLDRWCREHDATIDERVRLLLPICDAVAHAHARLIVHRDLKPANILVDGRGAPKLLDFGIAKCLDPLDGATQTATALRMLTPEYASPEQLRFHDATVATDVYALGVVLFELLAGRRPFRRRGDSGALFRAILEEPAPKVSSTALDHLESPRSERWSRLLAGDLDAIVDRALAKAPGDRYVSPHALAQDLERHLERRPVEARPPTWLYRWSKLARRRWRELSVAIVLGALLVLRLIDAETIRQERDRATLTRDVLVEILREASPVQRRGEEPSLRAVLDLGVAKLGQFDDRPELQAFLRHTYAEIYTTLGAHAAAEPLYEEALETDRFATGEQRVELLNSMAVLRRDQGRLDEAEALLRQAKARVTQSTSPELAFRIEQNLGLTLVDLGRLDAAESVLRQALKRAWEQALAPEVQASGYNNLGYCRATQERFDDALVQFRRATELNRWQLGEDHAETATSLGNLGSIAYATGRFAEAEEATRAALDIWRRREANHPMTALLLGNLGSIQRSRGDLEAAEQTYIESVELHERLLGTDHPDTAVAWNNLANTLADTGRVDEAARYLRRAHDVFVEARGPDHPETVAVLWNRVAVELDAGVPHAADPWIRRFEALAADPNIPPSVLGEGAGLMRRMLREQGRDAEADRLAERFPPTKAAP